MRVENLNGAASPTTRNMLLTFRLVNIDIILDTPSGLQAGPVERRLNRESEDPHSNCRAHYGIALRLSGYRRVSPGKGISGTAANADGVTSRCEGIHSEQLYGNLFAILCADGRQEFAPPLGCHAVADADPELLILKTSAY
jgi:hypothetical protein